MSSFTVPSELCQAQFAYAGGVNPLPCGFPALDPTNVIVQYTSGNPAVTQTLVAGIHYTINLDPAIGLVTITPTAQMPAAPGTITVTRNTPAVQPDQYTNAESFVADQVTTDFDRAQMGIAELKRRVTVLEGGPLAAPLTFVTTARPQRSIMSAADLPIRSSDQILNCSLAIPLNIPVPFWNTRGGVGLTFKVYRSSAAQPTLTMLAGDNVDGQANLPIPIGDSLTIVPANDGVNVGWAIE